jgi:hypothetical protein
MSSAVRVASVARIINTYGTTVTRADGTSFKGIVGKDTNDVSKHFGPYAIDELRERGAADVEVLYLVPADYSPAAMQRPFTVGIAPHARLYQMERARPQRDGDLIQSWHLLIYTGSLRNS